MKLFSKKSVLISAFFGGPLAVSILFWKNFKNFEDQRNAQKILYLGSAITIVLFLTLVNLPDEILGKTPHILIPLITVVLSKFLFDKFFKSKIQENTKQRKITYYSDWLAFLIGLICSILLLTLIFIFTFLFPLSEAEKFYEEKMNVFIENESKSLLFYSKMSNTSDFYLVRELDEVSIPAWEENIKLVKEIQLQEDLPSHLRKKTEHLLEYSELRYELFQFFKKDILSFRNENIFIIDSLHNEIDKKLDKINSLW